MRGSVSCYKFKGEFTDLHMQAIVNFEIDTKVVITHRTITITMLADKIHLHLCGHSIGVMCHCLFSIIYKVVRDLRNNERAESLK